MGSTKKKKEKKNSGFDDDDRDFSGGRRRLDLRGNQFGFSKQGGREENMANNEIMVVSN